MSTTDVCETSCHLQRISNLLEVPAAAYDVTPECTVPSACFSVQSPSIITVSRILTIPHTRVFPPAGGEVKCDISRHVGTFPRDFFT